MKITEKKIKKCALRFFGVDVLMVRSECFCAIVGPFFSPPMFNMERRFSNWGVQKGGAKSLTKI